MSEIRQLHREAVLLMKEASTALAHGDSITYLEIANKAFKLEKSAAIELISDFDAEPTRSVLYRSAATIAFNIGNYNEAEKLIHLGLAGNPFAELKEELEILLEKTEHAISINADISIGIENAYIENLKEKAINIKLEPQEPRYSKAIVLDYIVDFLKNIQNCFSNFSEVNFKKLFSEKDFTDYDKTLNLFKKDTKALCVGLKFKSFGVSVAVDTSIQNYRDITSPKFKKFKDTLFDDFKKEIFFADYNSIAYQNKIQDKYSAEERSKIFAPIIESLKEKSKYRISIVDKEFKDTIKTCPVINSKTQQILKPSIERTILFDDDDILLKRTFELTTSTGKKGEKILSENLDYAEFRLLLENINYSNKEAYFINPYELKVIFNRGVFIIDDENYKVYAEHKDFKEAQKLYSMSLIEKFTSLLKSETENTLSVDEYSLLDNMKSTIIKGW